MKHMLNMTQMVQYSLLCQMKTMWNKLIIIFMYAYGSVYDSLFIIKARYECELRPTSSEVLANCIGFKEN